MKKITLFGLLITAFASAQTTYNSTNFATAGESFTVNVAGDFLTADFTQTGANQTWDYSALTAASTDTQTWLDPENTGYKTTWCFLHFYIFNCNSQFSNAFNLANDATEGFDLSAAGVNNITNHYNLTDSVLQSKMLGLSADLNGTPVSFTVDYTDPDDVWHFPMNFGDDYSDDSTLNVDLSALGFPISVNGSNNRHNEVNGWGSLTTPAGTFASVLKVKTTLITDQTITYDGTEIPINTTTVMYSWFDPASGIPVLQATGTEVADVFVPTRVTFTGDVLSAPHFDSFAGISVYPNPTDGKLQLNTEINVKGVEVFDTLGQKVGQSLDVTALRSGVYFVKVYTDNGDFTRKVIRK
ncbi:T9SS type A sorting domain-containing protein [Flavobacterium silvaticum]|uniref:T9SS type A sorting domain-containing protein n=1 Tax=Flavobacterium silvaticum TaxID=1852020 RepID=A0A972FKP3_9FLAO|nr:T9SS type A sorting domain-containing protein [Flavobacterium silvaticum]NMH27804.1 T9SS type A sorting domain-containing protein [Flavobacterium silvaticum]